MLCRELCKNGWTARYAIWDLDSGGPMEPCIKWECNSPHAKAPFLGERTCQGMPKDTLPWAVQKWMSQLRCCVGCGHGIWIGWAILQDSVLVTDWQTDHTTWLVTIGRINICSTAIWPKNTTNTTAVWKILTSFSHYGGRSANTESASTLENAEAQ